MENYLNKYAGFVKAVTSDPSSNKEDFIKSVTDLYDNGCDVARLLTASVGASAESGEFLEIVKKMIFQGKPYNEDNVFHMKRELGDIMFYIMNGAMALNIDPYEIIDENIRKLEARYPGGKFSIEKSEVRAEGDL